MTSSGHFARSLRLRRLYHHNPNRLMITPLDHSIGDGPVVPKGSSLDRLVGQLAAGGADGVVVHKGAVRHLRPDHFATMSLIIHLNASTAQAVDPDAKYLVTDVDEALRLGADAVSVHVNIGSLDERQQITDLARVADDCDRLNVPLMAMMYARGPRVTNPRDPELVAHAAQVAVDLGADIVKTVFLGSATEMLELTSAIPVPVLIAGGPQRGETEMLSFVSDALSGGAAGVAMGRNIFQAADPERLAGRVARLVHQFPGEHIDHLQGGQHHDERQAVLA